MAIEIQAKSPKIELRTQGPKGEQVQPDWNQNDETAKDYVKNRPFYAGTPVETVFVEESTVSFADMDGVYIGQLESIFVPTVGETYEVYWDGTIYECPCKYFHERNFIGNLSIAGDAPDTGEPFLIDSIMERANGDGIMIYTLDTSDSHTFSISGVVEPIVKIPSKDIDKDTSGYIVVHKNSTMTEEDVQNMMMPFRMEKQFLSSGTICVLIASSLMVII